jgi:hypothetical protein
MRKKPICNVNHSFRGVPSLLDHLPFGHREREERLEEQQVIVLLGKSPVATMTTEKSYWELLH